MNSWIKSNLGKIQREILDIKSALGIYAKPENHKTTFRGMELTEKYTIDEIFNMIVSGTLDDVYLGDTITKHLTGVFYEPFYGIAFEPDADYYEVSYSVANNFTNPIYTKTEDEAPQSGKVYATRIEVDEYVTFMIIDFDYYNNGFNPATYSFSHNAVIAPVGGFENKSAFGSNKLMTSQSSISLFNGADIYYVSLPSYSMLVKTAFDNKICAFQNSSSAWVSDSMDYSISNAWMYATLFATSQIVDGYSEFTANNGYDYNKFKIFNYKNLTELFGTSDNAWLRAYTGDDDVIQIVPKGQIKTVENQSEKHTILPYFLIGESEIL